MAQLKLLGQPRYSQTPTVFPISLHRDSPSVPFDFEVAGFNIADVVSIVVKEMVDGKIGKDIVIPGCLPRLQAEGGGIPVSKVATGGLAEKEGIRPWDIIVEIDHIDATTSTPDFVTAKINSLLNLNIKVLRVEEVARELDQPNRYVKIDKKAPKK